MKIIKIAVGKIKPNPNQPRKSFDKEKIKELANSIKSCGLINPINVRKTKKGYELISGERRLKAHKLAKIKTIQSIISNQSNHQILISGLVENLQRENLSEYEKAVFIRKLYNNGMKKFEICKELGKSYSYIESLLALTEKKYIHLAKAVKKKKINLRIFEDIKRLKSINEQKRLLNKIIKEKINSSKVRDIVNVIRSSPKDVGEALLKNKIQISQATGVSKIKDEDTRRKIITAHEDIRKIDNSIEKNFKDKKQNPKNNHKIIKIKEFIDYFRFNAIENQKTIQSVISSLMKCVPYINIMDTQQLEKLKHYQDLLEINLTNALELSKNLKEKVENQII